MQSDTWWREAVFYQIYPRSFADGNGDGIGDFAGMIGKLDYLLDLGIDAIWLSPHYPSPQKDCGYDISDYRGVASEYGTLEEFKAFLDGAHERGIRVVLDLVLNHTSDEHPWFQLSRSGLDHEKRDWYVWHDGRVTPEGTRLPPNNWESGFGGSAWEYDAQTEQYYYHFFLKEQPDLNWRNPDVKSAMWDVVHFWMGLGVDGFRLDAITTIFEDLEFRDHESGTTLVGLYRMSEATGDSESRAAIYALWEKHFKYQVAQPELHGLMKELRGEVDAYPGSVLIGEDDDVAYYGNGDDELHLVFNFPLMRTDQLTPDHVRQNQAERLSTLPEGAWPCNTLGNHDSSRVWSAFGDGIHDRELAQISAALVLTLRGTPFLYYGEEIGMVDRPPEDLGEIKDTMALRHYDLALAHGMSPLEAFAIAQQTSRDACRTPMQWQSTPNAGFSPEDVETWLPVHSNFAEGVNVAEQQGDPESMLSFYRRLLQLRKTSPALKAGAYRPLLEDDPDCLCYLRVAENQTVLVVLNFGEEDRTLTLPGLSAYTGRVLFSTASRQDAVGLGEVDIEPFGIYITEVDGVQRKNLAT
ncbi:MAG: glycoside hydrolase family 13 protein [Anaerolineae bacterium]